MRGTSDLAKSFFSPFIVGPRAPEPLESVMVYLVNYMASSKLTKGHREKTIMLWIKQLVELNPEISPQMVYARNAKKK